MTQEFQHNGFQKWCWQQSDHGSNLHIFRQTGSKPHPHNLHQRIHNRFLRNEMFSKVALLTWLAHKILVVLIKILKTLYYNE